jgi:histidinol-phosphate aminotransferase
LIPYEPGKPIEEVEREFGISGSVKLASNENPSGTVAESARGLRERLPELHLYPDGDCFYLKRALAQKLGVEPDRLIFGNGSNEIIELAVRTFMRPGNEAVMAEQAFVVYELIVQAVGGKRTTVPLKNFTHDLAAIADAVTPQTRLVFLANPNNPTGTIYRRREWETFLERISPDILVIVDEAYFEYVGEADYPNSLDYHAHHPAILTLRTFSKLYGLAGLRIGYGIGAEGCHCLDAPRAPAVQRQCAGAVGRAGRLGRHRACAAQPRNQSAGNEISAGGICAARSLVRAECGKFYPGSGRQRLRGFPKVT